MKSVSLINLKTSQATPAGSFSQEPLGLCYLKSFLESKGHTVFLFDLNYDTISLDELSTFLIKHNSSVVGIQLNQFSLDNLNDILLMMPPKVHIVAGGLFATLAHKELLTQFERLDSIVLGEGEETINQLIEHLENNLDLHLVEGLAWKLNKKLIVNTFRKPFENLDLLPFPDRSLFKKYSLTGPLGISGSRGCPWSNCSFCCTAACVKLLNYPLWRGRSVQNIVEEISYLVSAQGVTDFFFVDDCFFSSFNILERAKELKNILEEKNLSITFSMDCRVNQISEDVLIVLKSAGLKYLYVGLEGFDDEYLSRLKKGQTSKQIFDLVSLCKRLDVELKIGFITFSHDMSLATVHTQLKFLFDFGFFKRSLLTNLLVPYYNTDLYLQLVSEGKIDSLNFKPQLFWNDKRVGLIYFFIDSVEKKVSSHLLSEKQFENLMQRLVILLESEPSFDSLKISLQELVSV